MFSLWLTRISVHNSVIEVCGVGIQKTIDWQVWSHEHVRSKLLWCHLYT